MCKRLTGPEAQPLLRINMWFNNPLEYAQWLANGGKLPRRLQVNQRRLNGRIMAMSTGLRITAAIALAPTIAVWWMWKYATRGKLL